MDQRYFVEIRKEPTGFQLAIHQGDADKPLVRSSVNVDETTTVSNGSGTLGDLIRNLLEAAPVFLRERFHERPQIGVGRYLYDETLGRLDRDLPAEADVRIHVVTDDEYVAQLPWTLLARGGDFLSASGWSVALSRPGRATRPCELPPSPKILVVAPQPAGEPETDAEAHLEELELMLSGADRHFEQGKHLRTVTTWEDFRNGVRDLRPDIVYYYGHGVCEGGTTRLVFAQGPDAERIDVPVADVAQCLRQAGLRQAGLRRTDGRTPVLAYVNCCHGDSGGLLGAGWQLGDVVPAVWLRVLALSVGTYPERLDRDLSKLPYLGVLLKDHQDIEDLGTSGRYT